MCKDHIKFGIEVHPANTELFNTKGEEKITLYKGNCIGCHPDTNDWCNPELMIDMPKYRKLLKKRKCSEEKLKKSLETFEVPRHWKQEDIDGFLIEVFHPSPQRLMYEKSTIYHYFCG